MTDTDKIGCMGHSLGGATGIALGRERDDIDAVIDFDGTVLGEVVEIKNGKCVPNDTPYPVPVLVFSNGENGEEGQSVRLLTVFVKCYLILFQKTYPDDSDQTARLPTSR